MDTPVKPSPFGDACPSCHPGDVPAAFPRGMYQTADGHLSAAYECAACGHAWRTVWQVTDAWPVRRAELPRGPETLALLDEVISILAFALSSEKREPASREETAA